MAVVDLVGGPAGFLNVFVAGRGLLPALKAEAVARDQADDQEEHEGGVKHQEQHHGGGHRHGRHMALVPGDDEVVAVAFGDQVDQPAEEAGEDVLDVPGGALGVLGLGAVHGSLLAGVVVVIELAFLFQGHHGLQDVPAGLFQGAARLLVGDAGLLAQGLRHLKMIHKYLPFRIPGPVVGISRACFQGHHSG